MGRRKKKMRAIFQQCVCVPETLIIVLRKSKLKLKARKIWNLGAKVLHAAASAAALLYTFCNTKNCASAAAAVRCLPAQGTHS